MPPVVYWTAKLKHTGLTACKRFENCERKIHRHSLSNLLQNAVPKESRNLNVVQSRKCKVLCNKLAYYTQTRKFTSKRTGKYSMKVAFLTLTTPESCTTEQSLKAFEHFLDYLRRTANCVYVWKKELGETNKHLHYHVLINNFIPFYIVSWKWKRLLLAQGVQWPKNQNGEDSQSHYRIEMPRSRKAIGSYVAKYMSKAYELPKEYGYIFGYSELLKELSELVISEFDELWSEVSELACTCKVIGDDYVSHMCVDLLHVNSVAPKIGALFEEQYIRFSEIITLPQKFNYV